MRYLSDPWLAAAAAAVSAAVDPLPRSADITIQQVVTGSPDGDRTYAVVMAGQSLSLVPGSSAEPDVTFTQDWDTACGIAQGSLSAQAAFMNGRMKIGGNTNLLVENHDLLAEVDDLLGELRAQTTFDA